MVALANDHDVEATLGRPLTTEESARANAILEKASELFRLESGQQFTMGTSHVRLKVNGGRVYLRQKPVVSITNVTSDSGAPVTWELFSQWLTVPRASHEFVRVQYVHGGPVPDLVRLTVAEVAKKVLTIDPKAAAGIVQTSTTAGPYTAADTYATWAHGGQTLLAPEDKAIAASFRVRVPNVVIQSF